MLELKSIVKTYETGDTVVKALDGVSLCFRENEFVSILGASGCGKTTMLNIIGGLDRYTSGDLIINGRSTKLFKDSDWDTYRNHSVGFVFQSYNLIPHQTVLSNVELALTLSGVSKSERRKRATEALTKVGLGDQLHKKPNQMSGGQMQRVAIARALVNNPDILLADEPTGALDTTTSVQIMELLGEVAKDRLVIMVTHNPELAEEYSSRIVRLRDGQVIGDTNPITEEEYAALSKENEEKAIAAQKEKKTRKQKNAEQKTSMSFFTALSLSLNNLLTKKGRTILTSFAGSIGIIGIALILSLSNGIQAYIDQVQEDTLSTYPLTIQKETQDFTSMLSAMTEVNSTEDYSESGQIHVDDSLGTMMSAMSATVENNLKDFKAYLDAHYDEIEGYVSDIQYTYDFDLQVFTADGKTQVNPTAIFKNMGEAFSSVGEMMEMSPMGGMGVMSEMIDNQELLDQQYDVIAGNWPTSPDEVVLVVSSNNQISKMALYMLGVLDQSELEDIMEALMTNGEYDTTPIEPYDYDYFLNMKFLLLNTADFFVESPVGATYTVDGTEYKVWNDIRESFGYDQAAFVTENGTELKISGIIRPKSGVAATSINGAIGYTKGLTKMILDANAENEVIDQQKQTPNHNVLTGLPFERTVYTKENIGELIRTIDAAKMDSIYAAMTARVKEVYEDNPPVTNAESFMGFVSFMSDAELTTLLENMFAAAPAPTHPVVFGALAGTLGENSPIIVDSFEDLTKVLPILTTEQRMTVVGTLMQVCGEEAMQNIYDAMNQIIMNMEVDENTFVILLQMMDDAQFAETQDMLYQMAPQTDATLESTLKTLGDAEQAEPASINFYAKDFESKDNIEAFISDYNNSVDEIDKLQYTDMVGVMMSSVTIIINVISYVLIAFVSISLVVSSIMIGIIT